MTRRARCASTRSSSPGGGRDRPRRRPTDPAKPAKPSPDFPLFAHAAGVWAKKIRGKLHSFGPRNDPDGALAKYLAQKDDLHAGRKPKGQEASAGVSVRDLCNKFLNFKRNLVASGEWSNRSWQDDKAACDLIVRHFGKGRLLTDLGPDDFAALRNKMAKHRFLIRRRYSAGFCNKCLGMRSFSIPSNATSVRIASRAAGITPHRMR